jgi:predicted nucleic acid-binding Zn ribbon protein
MPNTISVPTLHPHIKCSVCGKPGTETVSFFKRQDKWHKYVHSVKNTCACWKLLNA